ncbi:MAG: IS3 family transposase [bacterium]|nr:IS3 family transposase [bacterium]
MAVLKHEESFFNHKKVERLMKINGIVAKTKRKFKVAKNAKHNYPVAPNKLYLSDISYMRTKKGWLYLAAVLDAYTRKIVGFSMSERQTKKFIKNILLYTITQQKINGEIILHSDQGKQYASYSYRDLCKEYGFIQSMSGRGNCYDNAMMESFFHTLKTEKVYWQNYETRAEAKTSIFKYIEINYNRMRLHSGIGYKTPVEFEMLAKRLQN